MITVKNRKLVTFTNSLYSVPDNFVVSSKTINGYLLIDEEMVENIDKVDFNHVEREED